MLRSPLMVLVFLVGSIIGGLPTVSADETGSIGGTVSNGTPNGGTVAGLTVTLSRYQGMDLGQTYTTTTDSTGSYRFEGLPVVDGEAYIVRVSYLRVNYPGRMVQLVEEPNPTVDIAVHETTSDPAQVALSSRRVIIAGADPVFRLIEVIEILAVENAGDRSYTGANGEVLRLPLPDGAAQITPEAGFDFGDARVDRGTLVTTGPIPPGNHDVMLTYRIPYQGTSATLSLGTAMPTGSLRVLARQGTYTLSSPALNDSGSVDVSGNAYQLLTRDSLSAGESVAVTLGRLPKAGTSGASPARAPLYAALAAGIGLLLAGGLVLQTLRHRSRQASPVSSSRPPVAGDRSGAEAERLALAARLNQLDEARAAGQIDAIAYEADRRQVLAELHQRSRPLPRRDETGL